MSEMTKYPIEKLVESKYNSRKVFDKQEMADLIASIKEKGIRVPLIIRSLGSGSSMYEVVAGARRLRAARELKLETVPAVYQEMNDEEAREVQIIENLQRADLHPLEEAQAFGKLAVEHKLSLSDVGLKVGKPERYVRQRMVLTNLIQPVAEAFKKGTITIGVAFIAARETAEHQKEFAKEQLNERQGGWVPDEDDATRFFQEFHLDLAKTPFDKSDAKLVPEAGACTTCPKRTGNNALLFPEIKSGDTCTDRTCFEKKQSAFVQIQVKANPKAVKLSVLGDYSPVKPTGTREWLPAGTKVCKDIKPGIVIQRDPQNIYKLQDVPLGKALDVCVNKNCKVHWPAAGAKQETVRTGTGNKLSPAEKKRRAAERIAVKVDDQAFNAMVAILRTKPKVIKVEDIRRVTLAVCGVYSFKWACRWLAPAFGLKAEGDTDSQAGANGQEHLVKFLKTAKLEDCVAFLVASELTPGQYGSDKARKLMRDCAKRFGVNVAKIEKAIIAAKNAPKAPKKGLLRHSADLAGVKKRQAISPRPKKVKAA